MILGKFFGAIRAQLNKLANYFWEADPIAQMQYEYDQAVAQLQDGRKGLEQYRALVERVTFQVNNDQKHVTDLESKVKAYLQAGDRETASKFALELQKAKAELATYLREHTHIGSRIVGVEAVDHPTDGQIVAYAKKHFKIGTLRGDAPASR